MRLLIVTIALSVGTMFFQSAAGLAETLISEAEAKLPPSTDVGMTTRGLTRGPGIELVSPHSDRGMASPLPLKVKFIARNNVEIDPATVRVIYLKAQSVDLTDRVKKFLTADGIDMANAEMPSGTHYLRINLKDKQDRASTATIKLVVAPIP